MRSARAVLVVFLLALVAGAQVPVPLRFPGFTTPRFGAGLQVSTLGLGAEFATRVTDSTNLRLGFSGFNYSRGVNHDGIAYAGALGLRSVAAHLDWYFWGPLHLSPGWLLYNGNHLSGSASVPGGQSFSLGGTTYTSSTSDPVVGTGSMQARRSAPMLTIGLGNLVPRGGGHFGLDAEVGAAYQGAPQALLTLSGTACDPSGLVCQPVSAAQVQANVVAEQNKLNSKVSRFKYFPIIALGFHFGF